MECTLCQSTGLKSVLSKVFTGLSWQCESCDLIFKDPQAYWGWDEQKARYDQHNNSINSPGYVQYFEKLLSPLMPVLLHQRIHHGLDWGSGPQPVLRELMQRRNVKLDIYDPIYQSSEENLHSEYPLITCTEVIEHFVDPRKSFAKMDGYLSANGVFAGMTNFHHGPDHYAGWWYAKDPTHVCFFSEKTLKWLADFLGWEILLLDNPVFIFLKKQ